MKIRLKAHLEEMERFQKADTLLFNFKNDKDDMNKIRESILSIQNNLKDHINMFNSVEESKQRDTVGSVK